jgi:transketolase
VSPNAKTPYHYIRSAILPLLGSADVFSKAKQQPTRYAYADAILELGELNPDVVVLDADVSKSIGTNKSPSRT